MGKKKASELAMNTRTSIQKNASHYTLATLDTSKSLDSFITEVEIKGSEAQNVKMHHLMMEDATAFLKATPTTKTLRASHNQFRIALSNVLIDRNKDPTMPKKCRCGADVDPEGHHFQTCKRLGGIYLKHNALNGVIMSACIDAGLPARREPAGIFPDDHRRPDIEIIGLDHSGKTTLIDGTIRDPIAPSNLKAEFKHLATCLKDAEIEKRTHYKDIDEEEFKLIPFAVSSLGGMSEEARETFLNNIVNRIPSDPEHWKPTNFTARTPTQYYTQRLSLTIHTSAAYHSEMLKKMSVKLGPIKQK